MSKQLSSKWRYMFLLKKNKKHQGYMNRNRNPTVQSIKAIVKNPLHY